MCVCVFLCAAVWKSGRGTVLLSPPCLRLRLKQGHCRGWRTYGWMSHTFLVSWRVERTDEKHRCVLKIHNIRTLFYHVWYCFFCLCNGRTPPQSPPLPFKWLFSVATRHLKELRFNVHRHRLTAEVQFRLWIGYKDLLGQFLGHRLRAIYSSLLSLIYTKCPPGIN